MSRALRSSSTATMRCCSSSAVMVVLCIRSGPARGRGARAGMAVQGMLANLLPDRVRQQVAWRAPRRDQGAQAGGGDGQLGDTQHGDAATGSAVELVRSEERRVGKGRTARATPDDAKEGRDGGQR